MAGGSVQFILGRAGSGKSARLRDAIVARLMAKPLGPPLVLLTPPQATFEHERLFANDSGLLGFARLRVVDVDALGDLLLRDADQPAAAAVTPLGRQLMLGHLLRELGDRLGYFRAAGRHAGTVVEIDRALAELEQAGTSPGDVLDDLANEENDLAAKLRDLTLIGDAYGKLLGDRLDAGRRAQALLDAAATWLPARTAELFVDGFGEVGPVERRLIVALASAGATVQIALTLDPDEPEDAADSLFAGAAESHRRLRAACLAARVRVEPPVLLAERPRFRAPALSLIERDFTNPRPGRFTGDSSAVQLIDAPTAAAQAEAAARQVKTWTRQGLRLRECAILYRAGDVHADAVLAALRDHGLRGFADRRRPAQHGPVVRFARSLLRVAAFGWPNDAAFALFKSGLAGLDANEVDLLENFVRDRRIRGRRMWTRDEPWTGVPRNVADEEGLAVQSEDAAVADRLRRRVLAFVQPLAAVLNGLDRPIGEQVAALRKAIETAGAGERLAAWIAAAEVTGDVEAAADHRQAWAALIELLDQTDTLLGDTVASGRAFARTIEFGLDQLTFAVAPPTRDAVTVGSVDRVVLPPGRCRACVVIGLNDGEFPAQRDAANVLGDDDRRRLRDRAVDVEIGDAERQRRERSLAYRAFTLASERLTLIRNTSDDAGRATLASPFWHHVQTLLHAEVEHVPSGPTPAALAASPQAVVSAALAWARGEADPEDPDAAAYAVVADDPPPALDRLLAQAWPALSYANDPALREATRQSLLGDALSTSVSRLETFAACPFRHYAAHVLKLRPRPDDEATPRDLGIVAHGVLERLVSEVIAEQLDLIADPDAAYAALPALAEEVATRLRDGVLHRDARGQYLIGRVERTLERVLAGQRAALSLGNFRPWKTELTFGGQDGLLPPLSLATPDGRRVDLYGRIDRVDLAPEGQAAVVVDYKAVGRDVQLRMNDVRHCLALQLLTYLLVLREHGGRLASPAPQPMAGLYVKLLRGLDKDDPDKAPAPEDATFDLRVKPRGVIDIDCVPWLDRQFHDPDGEHLPPGRSDGWAINIKRDGEPYATGTDIVMSETFDDLLDFVRLQVRELAAGILDGDIAVRPYRIGRRTPCAHCEFRSVCRHEPSVNGYVQLTTARESDPMDAIAKGAERQRQAERTASCPA